MNQDFIINLYKYFARFVSDEVLGRSLVQPEHSRKPGYNEISAEIRTGKRYPFPLIQRLIVSINENFVSESIRNTKGIVLFVEYGKFRIDNTANGVRESIAVTAAHDFSDKNNDNLNETIVMNDCLNTLLRILSQMIEDQEDRDFCGVEELITFPYSIQPVDPASFYGFGGWCAMFENSNTML